MRESMIIMGFAKRKGTNKKTGNEWEFLAVDTLVPRRNDRFVVECGGFEPREFSVHDDAISYLRNVKKFPSEHIADMEIGRDSKIRIVGFSAVQGLKSAESA